MFQKLNNATLKKSAQIFSALGDETRLRLVKNLIDGEEKTVSQLSKKTEMTRQGITKHLRVLENVGLVKNSRVGRESFFKLEIAPLENVKETLNLFETQWEQTLNRFKHFVEKKNKGN